MTGKPTRSRTKQFLIDFLLAAHDPLLSLLALLPNLRPGILSAAPLDRLVILRSLSSVSFPKASDVGIVGPNHRVRCAFPRRPPRSAAPSRPERFGHSS